MTELTAKTANGTNGADGKDGTNGATGKNALLRSSHELAGDNTASATWTASAAHTREFASKHASTQTVTARWPTPKPTRLRPRSCAGSSLHAISGFAKYGALNNLWTNLTTLESDATTVADPTLLTAGDTLVAAYVRGGKAYVRASGHTLRSFMR